jgi:hypothetical protein
MEIWLTVIPSLRMRSSEIWQYEVSHVVTNILQKPAAFIFKLPTLWRNPLPSSPRCQQFGITCCLHLKSTNIFKKICCHCVQGTSTEAIASISKVSTSWRYLSGSPRHQHFRETYSLHFRGTCYLHFQSTKISEAPVVCISKVPKFWRHLTVPTFWKRISNFQQSHF